MKKISNLLNFILILNFLYFTGTNISGSAEPEKKWEFSGNYQPYSQKLWDFYGQFFDLSCEDRNDVLYENYARLYPEFRQYMADDEMRRNWRHSLITKGYEGFESFNHCLHQELRERWDRAADSGNNKSILYCGRIAEGLNEADMNGALAAAELGEYAIIGRSLPVLMVAHGNLADKRIRLNDDLAYYLQLHIKSFMNAGLKRSSEMWKNYTKLLDPNAGKTLTLKRRKFLDKAFTNGNHIKVLEATAPCQGA